MTLKMDKTTFDQWWRETLSFLKFKFRGSLQADLEDALSEAFLALVKDQQTDRKLTFSKMSLKRLAFCKTVDAWRKKQRQPITNCLSSTYSLSIDCFCEEAEEDLLEPVINHLSTLKQRHRALLEYKYRAISLDKVRQMKHDGELHTFMDNEYDDHMIVEMFGFTNTQSVRTERSRALKELRQSVLIKQY